MFDARYRNDEVGAAAYHPGVLLKVVLLGYARGLTSSRAIERACRENIVFMALSGDSAPHVTTIASFVSKLPNQITAVFRDVLLVCDEQGLVARELFAVDGCELPSNASRTWKHLGKVTDPQYRECGPQTARSAAVTMNRFARPATAIRAPMGVPPPMARLRECATAIFLQPRWAS